MKKIEVKVTKYKCENCGTIHTRKDDIIHCYITGKEICTKCAKYLNSIYYYDDDIYPQQGVYVEASLVDIDGRSRETYLEKKHKLEEEFRKNIDELNKAYITGKL